VVVTFEDTKIRKPAPAPFEMILKKLQISANEVLMVGDWVERDIVGAANVGMKTAFAKYGDTFNTIQHNANYKLNDISEIIDIILKENGL
jgi:putative hydrolase of the HAD superfamily